MGSGGGDDGGKGRSGDRPGLIVYFLSRIVHNQSRQEPLHFIPSNPNFISAPGGPSPGTSLAVHDLIPQDIASRPPYSVISAVSHLPLSQASASSWHLGVPSPDGVVTCRQWRVNVRPSAKCTGAPGLLLYVLRATAVYRHPAEDLEPTWRTRPWARRPTYQSTS